MARLFFALWPDEPVREQLSGVTARLPARIGRIIPARNMHITLVFLGHVEESVALRVAAGCAGVRTRSFELVLDSAGWWRGPHVAWLAPQAVVPEALLSLVRSIDGICRSCDVALEQREYRPHLTLARQVRRRPPRIEFPPIRWPVTEFCLVESAAGKGVSEYRIRQRWPLTGV